MPRRRLGAVLLFPEPVHTELVGLRRAIGCPSLERQAPHLTLVPPVNVHERDIPGALRLLRRAASASRPLTLRLGPVASFPGDPSVVHLSVDAEPDVLDALHELRRALLVPPLERRVDAAFVPHVTLHESAAPALDAAAHVALAAYRCEVTVGAVHLLEADRDRVWRPLADAELGRIAARDARDARD